jgi:hypothetical protein
MGIMDNEFNLHNYGKAMMNGKPNDIKIYFHG